MKNENSEVVVKMAALTGKNEALAARLEAIELERIRDREIGAAMKRLETRPLGADLEQRLVAFHKDHGSKAFAAYVDAMANTVGPAKNETTNGTDIGNRVTSKAVMKYVEEGPEAVARATKFSAIWSELHSRGLTSKSEERYIAINMAMAAQG